MPENVPTQPPTLVIVGAASRDLDAADQRGWRLGGTVTYSAIAAANLGVRVRALVGVDALSETAHELETLRIAGVEVLTVRLQQAPIFDNRHTEEGRVQYALGVSDELPTAALPADWRHPDGALLGLVAGELGEGWAEAFPQTTFVGLAAQGLVRGLQPGQAVERLPLPRSGLIDRSDAILVSAEDVVGQPTGLEPLVANGKRLVVSHGERGALLLRRPGDGRTVGRYLPPTPRRDATDTVGAGDVFLAAWIAAHLLLKTADDWRALVVASVMASLSVERTALADFPTRRELCEVLVRLRDRHLD
ncbi:MAG: PfkB family carbohydrate kinase [Candidatus Limnocylindrales bacterium]